MAPLSTSTHFTRRTIVKRKVITLSTFFTLVFFGLLIIAAAPVVGQEKTDNHPELSEQEMLIACADCHRETTPELQEQWYNSVHGIGMVKCYQCHGTFETFRVTPTRENCATCHADMLGKCPADKPCWECHVPHSFKSK